MAASVVHRVVVRAIVISSESNRFLLQEIENPEAGGRVWLLPGGGLNPNEGLREGLERELLEETGYKIRSFSGPVWRGVCEYRFGGVVYRQTEHFLLVRVPQFEVQSEKNPDAKELAIHRNWRWWKLEEIVSSRTTFSPPRLGEYLQRLLCDRGSGCIEISFGT
jgi:ADP-ribose pyrophosphatase YjhB (NUDIX family)